MSAQSVVEDILKRARSTGQLDWKTARDEIHAEHARATTSDERAMLVAAFVVIMDRVEKTAIPPENLAKFRETRAKDYNLLVVSEAVVDGNVSPTLLDAVTRREIAAGRMAADHDLRELATIGERFGIGAVSTAVNPVEAAKKRSGWNPLQKLEGETEVTNAAKAGAVVNGFLVLTYLIQLAFVYGSGSDMFGNEGLSVLISDSLAVVIAAFLTWRILARQPLWASIVTCVWFAVELAMKIAAIVNGQQKPNVGYVIMFASLVVASVLSLRGSWKLRSLRRAAAPRG